MEVFDVVDRIREGEAVHAEARAERTRLLATLSPAGYDIPDPINGKAVEGRLEVRSVGGTIACAYWRHGITVIAEHWSTEKLSELLTGLQYCEGKRTPYEGRGTMFDATFWDAFRSQEAGRRQIERCLSTLLPNVMPAAREFAVYDTAWSRGGSDGPDMLSPAPPRSIFTYEGSPRFVAGIASTLDDDLALAVTSRVRENHVPLIDFRNEYWIEDAEQTLARLGLHGGQLVDSGNGLHYYGAQSLDTHSFTSFCQRMMQEESIGELYPSACLMQGFAMLRIAPSRYKLSFPMPVA